MTKQFHITDDATGRVVRQGTIDDDATYPVSVAGRTLHAGLPDEPIAVAPPTPPAPAEAPPDARRKIDGGFYSSALGAAHRYPSKDQDQTNMVQSATTGGALWCQPVTAGKLGAWVLADHTAEQATAVLTSFVKMRDAARKGS